MAGDLRALKNVDELLSWVVEGDVIEIPSASTAGDSQWAVFVGKGHVVHVDQITSQVSRSTLRIFCGDSFGRVNNLEDLMEGRIPRTSLEIVNSAQRRVGKVTNLASKDFVMSCRSLEKSELEDKKGSNSCGLFCWCCPCCKS